MPDKAIQTFRNIKILAQLSWGFLAGIMTILLLEKGLDMATAGLYFSLYSIGVLLLEMPTGAFADAFGRKKTIIAGFFFYLAFSIALIFLPESRFLVFSALFAAMADSLISGSAEAHAVDMLAVRRKLSYTEKLLSSGLSSGFAVLLFSSIIGGYSATFSIDIPLFICALFALAGIVYSWQALDEKGRKTMNFDHAEKRLFHGMLSAMSESWKNRIVRSIFIFSVFFGLGVSGFFIYWQPVLAEIGGWDTDTLGFFFAIMSAAMILGSRLSGNFNASSKVLGAGGIMLAGLMFIFSGIDHFFVLAMLIIIWEIGWGFITPMQNALLNHNTASNIRATVISIRAMLFRLGWVIFGGIVFLAEAADPRLFWTVGALSLFAGSAFLLLNRGS